MEYYKNYNTPVIKNYNTPARLGVNLLKANFALPF